MVIGGGRRHQPEETVDPITGSRVRKFARSRDYAGRGVATTATYEARALGVHSAMGLMKAARLAPDAVLLPADFDAYRELFAPLQGGGACDRAARWKISGIDEIYIDLTDVRLPAGATAAAANDPWQRARDRRADDQGRGARCDGAIVLDRRDAEQAALEDRLELDKPDGLTIVTEADIAERIWPLPVRKINGVGPRTARPASKRWASTPSANWRKPLRHG